MTDRIDPPEPPEPPDAIVQWPDEVDEILRGDLTAAAAYITPAGGTVVTGVAPCGLADRDRGTVGFTTSLGFGKKLERIVREPRVALAFHTREHGYATAPTFVLVQGCAKVDLTPSEQRLNGFAPQAQRYVGEVKQGPIWDRLLREYYRDRVFVDIAVRRVVAWPNGTADGPPQLHGGVAFTDPVPATPPRNGTAARIDPRRVARSMSTLPHRLLGYRGADGFPVVVPVQLAGHDQRGLRLVVPDGLLPKGGRRAGLLAHSFRPELVGLATRTCTGWLEVGPHGDAVYAPHTTKGFAAPPAKSLLLVTNGLMAKYGRWRARKDHTLEHLRALAAHQVPC